MNIFFLYSGPFGEQIINTISLSGQFTINGAYELSPGAVFGEEQGGPGDDPEFFENPDLFVPDDIPRGGADLLVVLGVNERFGDLVPSIARRLGVRSVLYPIDDRDMIPGAKKTIQD